MSVPYIVGAGQAFAAPAKRHKIRPVILTCALGIGIGIGLRLVLNANPGVIASILSGLKDIGMGIWNMLCDAAHACADFVHYIMHTRSG